MDKKIKSGEIKESELFEEANELLQKMKNMPGMGNIQSMLGKMGLPNLGGKNAKIDVNAMQSQLDRNLKMAKQRDRMRQKHSDNQQKQSQQNNKEANAVNLGLSQEQQEKEATIRKILDSGEDGDIEHLIFHPGGKKIVQTVEDLFADLGKNINDTKEVLNSYGNMSSATVLYVLERIMDKNPKKGDLGLMLSFGPGFSAQRVLLQF